MPERIQRQRTKGWRKPEGAVIVMRPGPFGNPFKVGGEYVFGSMSDPHLDVRGIPDAAEAVRLYRAWLMEPRHRGLLERVKAELRGKDLCCSCPLDQACHADVLLELANAPL